MIAYQVVYVVFNEISAMETTFYDITEALEYYEVLEQRKLFKVIIENGKEVRKSEIEITRWR